MSSAVCPAGSRELIAKVDPTRVTVCAERRTRQQKVDIRAIGSESTPTWSRCDALEKRNRVARNAPADASNAGRILDDGSAWVHTNG